MKVKVLSRNPADYIRENKSDIHKLHRNLDPSLHPLEGPREYTRALNAVKLERVFAKPFVSSLDGHTDGVNCIARHPRSLSVLLSGSCDGEVGVYFVLLKLNLICWRTTVLTCIFPIIHLVCTLNFALTSVSLSINAMPMTNLEQKLYAKLGVANKVHYVKCESGE